MANFEAAVTWITRNSIQFSPSGNPVSAFSLISRGLSELNVQSFHIQSHTYKCSGKYSYIYIPKRGVLVRTHDACLVTMAAIKKNNNYTI